MKSILRATAILSSASAVSIVMGIVSAKITAVLLGPAGIGYFGLLQSLLGLATLFASMGVGTGLVRAGAQALGRADAHELAALRRGAWLLSGLLGGAAVIIMTLLRGPLSRLMLGDATHAGAVVLVGVGLLFILAATVQTSILNAHHRVGDMARVGMTNSVLGVTATLLLIWTWRGRGIAPAVCAGCGISWAVSAYYTWTRTPAPPIALTLREVWTAARSLLRFGVPYTASLLVGGGVQLLLPVLVLHRLSTSGVGFYRAATSISINYLGFLIAAMGQDYYPRVSKVNDQPAALCQLINEQCRLVLLLGGPIILGMLALVPYLVPLIYSAQFVPTVALLEWQLIGDIFKFVSWTMSFVILARGSSTFFFTELLGGTCLLSFSWLGMRWFGLSGLGIGFMLCTGIYLLWCWGILRHQLRLRWTTENKLLFLSLLIAALIIRTLPYLGLANIRTAVALLLAALSGFGSLYLIWREVGGWQRLLDWRKTA